MCKRCKQLDELKDTYLDIIRYYRKLFLKDRALFKKIKFWLNVCVSSYIIEDKVPNRELVDLVFKVQKIIDRDMKFYGDIYKGGDGNGNS